MSPRTWIGIDVGTQSVRVLAIDDAGRRIGRGTAPLTSHRDGAVHEQNPAHWWSAVSAASRAALQDIAGETVAGVAVDATSGTILLADATGRPLTPGLMYDDRRATTQAEQANHAGSQVWSRLGYRRVQPPWALPKLLWLLAQHPEYRHGARLLHQADFVTWNLADHQLAADASHALKTGYDLVSRRWPHEVMDILQVPVEMLPDVAGPGDVLGHVGAQGSGATGIPAGTPIVAGMTDGCAAQIGAGALTPGAWNSVLGTTLVLKGVSKELISDPNGVVYCHRGPGGSWFPGGASSSGAGVLTARFPGQDLSALTDAAAGEPIGPVAYPLVSPGERFPFLAPEAAPFTIGESHGEAGQFAALLIGVACVERLCFDYLDQLGAPSNGPLSFTGGGARNAYWCGLRADLLGRVVTVPDEAEAAAGMAMLAAAGVTGERLGSIADALGGGATQIEPDPARGRELLATYEAFIDELAGRGWLDEATADHARERATR